MSLGSAAIRLTRSQEARPRSRLSRRALLGLAAASTGAAVSLTACGGDDGESRGGREEDLGLLNDALELEHAAVAAYGEGIAALKGELRSIAERFLAHEREHVDALSSAVTELGGTPSKARGDYPFPDLGDPDAVLRFAGDLELTTIAAYREAISKLSSGALRATAAQIMTTEAEHTYVLQGALDGARLPAAFVLGERKVEL